MTSDFFVSFPALYTFIAEGHTLNAVAITPPSTEEDSELELPPDIAHGATLVVGDPGTVEEGEETGSNVFTLVLPEEPTSPVGSAFTVVIPDAAGVVQVERTFFAVAESGKTELIARAKVLNGRPSVLPFVWTGSTYVLTSAPNVELIGD